MSYSYQSRAQKEKKRRKKSSYAKHSSFCNEIKPGNSSLPDPCKRGPEINVCTSPGLLSQPPCSYRTLRYVEESCAKRQRLLKTTFRVDFQGSQQMQSSRHTIYERY